MSNITWNDIPWSKSQRASLASVAEDDARPGYVIAQHQQSYTVITPDGERRGVVSGRLLHLSELGTVELPVVGDYVALSAAAGDVARIDAVLPRQSVYRRRRAGGEAEAQLIAANVDLVCVLTGADGDLSPRRIERYLSNLGVESAARALCLVTKADLVDDRSALERRMAHELPMTDIRVISVKSGYGLSNIPELSRSGTRIVLVGSSGCGKSTLINYLTGEESARTAAVRSGDDRGRHTTTARRLYRSAAGALLIDTPGMREVGLWADEEGDVLGEAFPEIVAHTEQCRFRDCTHRREPGCGVLSALERGEISPERYESFLKLRDELNTSIEERRERKRQFMKRVAKEVRRPRPW